MKYETFVRAVWQFLDPPSLADLGLSRFDEYLRALSFDPGIRDSVSERAEPVTENSTGGKTMMLPKDLLNDLEKTSMTKEDLFSGEARSHYAADYRTISDYLPNSQIEAFIREYSTAGHFQNMPGYIGFSLQQATNQLGNQLANVSQTQNMQGGLQ